MAKLEEYDDALARGVSECAAALLSAQWGSTVAIERVLNVFSNEPVRCKTAVRSVLGMLPARIDIEQINAYIEGSAELRVGAASEPDRGRKPGSSGAHHRARADHERAQSKVDRLCKELAEAERHAEALRSTRQECEDHLRYVAFFRLLVEMNRLLGGALSLGPLWALVRACSGYLQPDQEYERGLSDEDRKAYHLHLEDRQRMSREILQGLDLFAGDVDMEIELNKTLHGFVRKHLAPLEAEQREAARTNRKLSERAKRVKRRLEDLGTIRPGTKIADRHEVLGGLADQR